MRRVAVAPDSTVVDSNDRNTHDTPFTLSQISPRKPISLPRPSSPASTAPVSPMRPSRKRPVSVASSHQASKKGKTIVAAASKHVSKDGVRVFPSGINSSSDVPSWSGSSSRRAHATVTRKAGLIKNASTATTTSTALHQVSSIALDQDALDPRNASSPSTSCSNSLRQSRADPGLPEKHFVSRQAGETSSSAAPSLSSNILQRDNARVSSSPIFLVLAFHVSVQAQERRTACDHLSK
jgi:hypothetical protein